MTGVGDARPTLVDTHAHLQDPALHDDLGAVLLRAGEAGVAQVIAIGVTAEDSAEVVEIARRHPGVFAAVGVQPNHAAEAGPAIGSGSFLWPRRPRVVAIGETGLDRYWDHTPFPPSKIGSVNTSHSLSSRASPW